jgi:hypothetical protein
MPIYIVLVLAMMALIAMAATVAKVWHHQADSAESLRVLLGAQIACYDVKWRGIGGSMVVGLQAS